MVRRRAERFGLHFVAAGGKIHPPAGRTVGEVEPAGACSDQDRTERYIRAQSPDRADRVVDWSNPDGHLSHRI